MEIETFDKKFNLIFLSLIDLLIFAFFLFPYLLTRPTIFDLDFTKTGDIGDTIGGILGPIVGIVAVILTFLAFWVQFKANEQQKSDLKIERFENKFYKLLDLHKSNVQEATIGNYNGRESFVHRFYELKCCYHLVEGFHKKYASRNIGDENEIKNIDIMKFSYKIFFYGIGANSEKHYTHSFNNSEKYLFGKIKTCIENTIYRQYEIGIKSGNDKYVTINIFDVNYEFYYYPFDGHINKLGHYYRHLFQTANFIIEQKRFDDIEKYSYIKTLRAQLSNFEQLLLYYNSLAWFESEWRVLFTKYRLIKNIPIPLADFGTPPLENFDTEIQDYSNKGIQIFEWNE